MGEKGTVHGFVVILRHGEAISRELFAKVLDTREMQVDKCYVRAKRYEESGYMGCLGIGSAITSIVQRNVAHVAWRG